MEVNMDRRLVAALRYVILSDVVDDIISFLKKRGRLRNNMPESYYQDKHGLVWYADFHESGNSSEMEMNPKIKKDLLPYRMSTKATLYRGLFWAEKEDMDDFLKGSTEGDSINYSCGRSFESWTTDIQFASDWAKDTGFGVVIGAEFSPGHTILDTDMLPPEFNEALAYGNDEQEVLVESCPNKVKIVEIITE